MQDFSRLQKSEILHPVLAGLVYECSVTNPELPVGRIAERFGLSTLHVSEIIKHECARLKARKP